MAAAWLARRGWHVLDRNFRLGHKEIDLVARRGRVVAFVEVKTRTDTAFGHPLQAVTRRKRREIEAVARYWAERRGRPDDVYRFDAIAIVWPANGPALLDHVADAWRLRP